MGAMADLEEIERMQAETTKMAMKLVDEKDPQKILEMAAQIQERTAELEKMALGLAAAFAAKEAEGEEVRVLLTPDQRERIAESTGVGVEVVTLRDSKQRMWSKEMPSVEPREIEKMAAKQAAESRILAETKKTVEAVIKQLEALNVPELKDTIEELRRDPTLGRGKKQK
jgi:hypothetical protein